MTTGPTASAGIIGKTGTAVAFGANHLNYDTLNGMRLGTGVWLNDEHTLGGAFLFRGNGVSAHGRCRHSTPQPCHFYILGAEADAMQAERLQFSS